MQGFIKDFRKELDSDLWMMPPLYHRTWQYLKYMVNHQENKIPMRDGSFLTIKAGQHLTSIRDIAKNIGWYEGVKWKEPNPKTVSTILNWFESHEMISIEKGKGNRQYTLITLLNWDLYQSNDNEGNSKVTAREHLVDINKNDKECLKNDISSSAAEEHAREEPTGGVPTTEMVQLADADQRKGQIPGNSYEQIKTAYMRLAGVRGFDVSARDRQSIVDLLSYEIDTSKLLQWLEECFADYKPKHQFDKINSFSYCVPIILDKHVSEKEVKHDKKHSRRNGSVKKPSGESLTGGQVGRIRPKKESDTVREVSGSDGIY